MTIPIKNKCKRCNHEWLGRVVNPIQCPKCKSLYWDKDRVREIPVYQKANKEA